MKKDLRILSVSAEVAPYAKTGGLADVAGSLPEILSDMGMDVRVVLPGYREIDAEQVYITDFPVKMGNHQETCVLKQVKDATATTYTINNYHYYHRNGIYMQFMTTVKDLPFLCKASLDLCKAIGFKPDSDSYE